MTPIRARFNERRELVLPLEALEALGARPGDEVDVTVLSIASEDRLAAYRVATPPDDAERERRIAAVHAAAGTARNDQYPALSDDELEVEIRRARQEAAESRYLRSLRETE
ncbi:MAG: hypothetical protein IT302_11215 [Dehalococcoidia bacterium]|nr:hypothetical protein [Dehalococcoidia bacterium]